MGDVLDDLEELEVPEAGDLPLVPDPSDVEVPDVPDAPDIPDLSELPGADPDDVFDRLPGDPDPDRPCSFLPLHAPLDMPPSAREPLRLLGLGGLADWWDRAGDDLSEPRRFCEDL